ncbi:Fe-Mn family superoxide dismutase [Candidatus Parcubacteria bacterium]|nr:Fe-Mn family superoxide dismutase [Candidatus Parcubacteria bacterium]
MYQEQKFSIPELKGISKKSVDEHLKLYAGYVKHTNLILDKINEYAQDAEKHAYALGELQRRFSFEFNGMRNHEYYFKSLEGGPEMLGDNSMLKVAVEKEFGSWDGWLNRFKAITLTRGIGWAILYWDSHAKRLVNAWVDEQHLGQLNSVQYIVGIDMWEHAFYLDYATEKKKYVDAFFENLNWSVIENNFKSAQ